MKNINLLCKIAEENYPQFGTNFWGGSPENNYGFGTSNISQNIQNVANQLNSSGIGNGTNNVTTSGLDVGKGFGTANQPQNPNDPNCYMTFDGQNLNLYNNTGQVGSLDAQSGHNDFQSAQYQNVANKGPLPQGTYYAGQDQRQNITALDAVAGTGIGIANKLGANIHRGTWNGGPISWGTSRVWLRPDANTNTYGRSRFSIHGGLTKGEDIMDQFIDSADDLQKRYKLLKNIANNYPEHNKYVLTTVEQLSKKEQNNINNLGQIFELCNKIGNDSPELHPNVLETKRKVLANFCVNNPQQGLLFISSLTLDAYPSKDDLNVAYSGIIAILNSSKTNKNLYIPLVKILTECAKSGLNDSENKEKLEFICRNIDAKDKKLEAENILSNNRDISDIILASKKKVRANISKVSANHQLKEEKNTNKSNTQYRKKQKTPKKTEYQY